MIYQEISHSGKVEPKGRKSSDENTKQILGMHFERNNYASQVDIDEIQKKTFLEKGQVKNEKKMWNMGSISFLFN